MMPILVKSDERKWKKGQGSSWPVRAGMGVNRLKRNLELVVLCASKSINKNSSGERKFFCS